MTAVGATLWIVSNIMTDKYSNRNEIDYYNDEKKDRIINIIYISPRNKQTNNMYKYDK